MNNRPCIAGKAAVSSAALLALLLLAVTAWAEPPAVTSNAVAVADFEMDGAPAGTEDWAFGLADVMAVQLQQRGVTLFERQQIRIILAERRLTASGLMQLRRIPAQEIPDLQFLVTGSLRPLTNQQFHLEVSLVDARTGQNVAGFSREGRYPSEVAKAVSVLADQVVQRLQERGVPMPPETRPASPLRTPEVALLFYRGVNCCLAGEPELGFTWFVDTLNAAPNFLPARVWSLRAFEMLDLPEFAAAARAKLQRAPNGPGVLNRLGESRFTNKKLVSVAVIPDPGLDAAGRQAAAALKTALARQTNFFVADPANIRALAAEMDLQLTEKNEPGLELTSYLWSSVDALVLVKPAEDRKQPLQVELRDTLSGSIWFREQTGAKPAQLAKLSRDLSVRIASRREALSPEQHPEAPASGNIAPPPFHNNTNRYDFAALLKYVATNPKDRAALSHLAWFACWLNPVEAGYSDPGYELAVSDRMVAVTNPEEPEAAHWISEALWHRRAYEDYYGGARPLAVEAAPLLGRYADTPEGWYARSALALELATEKKYSEAAKLFLLLSDKLPALAQRVKIGPEYWANFYFFTAATLHETGDDEKARQFLAKAEEVLRAHPDLVIHEYARGVWVNHFPSSHPLFGKERNLRQAVAEWREKLNPPPGADTNAVTLAQLETMLTAARQATGAAADAAYLEFLRRLTEHKRQNPELYRGRITDYDVREPYRQFRLAHYVSGAGNYTLLGKLMIEAPGVLEEIYSRAGVAGQREELHRLAFALAEGLDPHIAAGFYEAVNERELALQKISDAINLHPPGSRTVRQEKIRLLQALGRPDDAVNYAREQIGTLDANADIDACVDAAEAHVAAGHPDAAAELFARLARARAPEENMDGTGARIRIFWADYETASGDYSEAAEILRGVIRHTEGKEWGIYLLRGYFNAYDAAVSRLADVRVRSRFPVASTDWQASPRPRLAAGPAETEPTELERDLAVLLNGTATGPDQRSYGGPEIRIFTKKYGRKAVPSLLRAAARDTFHARLIASFKLLDSVATAEDAPQVLDSFKRIPWLARTAFRLDPTNAAVILRERFPIYARGGDIPEELILEIETNKLRDQYPVLIANLAERNVDGNIVQVAAAIDRILQKDPGPEDIGQFRAALAAALEKIITRKYKYGLAGLGETALRNGMPEGIEALLRADDGRSTNCLATLRKYVDLPADDAAARTAVQARLGHWRWNNQTRKFVPETGRK